MPPLRHLLMFIVSLLALSESLFAQFDFVVTKKCAEAGNAESQFTLGWRYDEGRGLPQDHAEAAKWYRKAADQGHSDAIFFLGISHLYGSGVPKDEVESYAWFNILAVSNEQAEQKRDLIKLTPEKKAQAQKRSTELFNEIEARKKAAGK